MKRSFLQVLTLVLLAATVAVAQQRKPAEPAPTVEAGVAQVEEGDFEAAVKTLERVLQSLPDDAAHSQDRAKAYLYMAISYLGMSEEANARARFVDAVKQDKGLALNPRQFSPRVLALFEQAKREISGGPSAVRPAGDGARAGVFLIAVKGGDFAAVSQMLKEDPSLVTIKDQQYGATPLHWGALKGHDVIVGLLLAQGADPSATNKVGETPAAGGAAPAPREHRPAAAATRGPDLLGHQARRRGHGARDARPRPSLLNRRDAVFGATPLHWAALKGQEAVVGLLLARGADSKLTNGNGETPLQVATRAHKAGVVSLLQPLGTSGGGATGEASGGAPAATNGQGDLFAAAKAGDAARVRALLEKNPSWLNATDAAYGGTALHWAALRGHVEVVSFLMAAGADLEARNKAGETPLQAARRGGNKDVIAALTGLAEGGATK